MSELENGLKEIEQYRKKAAENGDFNVAAAYEKSVDIIRKHINDGWIPVEECPPEEPKENPEFEGKKIELYLVTVKGTKYPFRAMWNGKFFTDGWSKCNVIAWRPLPEPYKPPVESEEEKSMRERGEFFKDGE